MAERLIGRDAEIRASEHFLDAVADGPAALLIEGQAGIGKTTVWEETLRLSSTRSYHVLSCRPAAAETKLSFGALTDLLVGVGDDVIAELPKPQRRALDTARLRIDPGRRAPDQRAVFTGLVSSLGVMAREGPVVVGVDDAQWLDLASSRALAFAARRLRAHRIGILAAVRVDSDTAATFDRSLPEQLVSRIALGPLSLGAVYQLIRSRLGFTLPRPVLLRVHAAAGGNPFYALEIARALLRTGMPPLGEDIPIPGDLQQLVAERISRLPARTRGALIVASALSQPTTDLVDRPALEKAEQAGLVRIADGGRIAFAHPLFASAVYADVPERRRLRLHRQLAESVLDVEERARHLVRASAGPDEEVALALDEAADHATRRGAPEVAAELEEEAAHRTPPDADAARWQRLLDSAEHLIHAGDGDRARSLAERVVADSSSGAVRGRALRLIAETCYRDRMADAPALLEEALASVAGDPAAVVDIEESLAFVAVATGNLSEMERHGRRAAELAESLGATAVLAEALALMEMCRFFMARGVDDAILERALALEDPERQVPVQMRPSMTAAQLYEWTGKFERANELLFGLRERVTERGEESDLPFVLIHLAAAHFLMGAHDAAERYADEALEAAALVGSELLRGFALNIRAHVRARVGDMPRAREDSLEALAISERVGWPHGVLAARWTLGFLALSEGDPRGAADALEPVVAAVEALGLYDWATAMYIPDAIEALVGIGELERAMRLTDELAACGRRLDRAWALATSGRCRALIQAAQGDLDAALASIDSALVEHQRVAMPFEHGRSLLVRGRIQRRARQKRAAHETLEHALSLFEELGALVWAQTARNELGRIGLRRSAPSELTDTEDRVAELAASGLTNKQIAQRAFLTPKSVEDVLHRVYRKLDIHSRAELGARMVVRARD